MISVIRTVNGTFNIFGTHNDGFIIQGNLNEAQLRELIDKAQKALS